MPVVSKIIEILPLYNNNFFLKIDAFFIKKILSLCLLIGKPIRNTKKLMRVW